MPTIRQKKAYKNLSENLGNKGDALRSAGYSASIAKTPKIVTESKGWKELVEADMPKEMVANKHKELFAAAAISKFSFGSKQSDENIKSIIESVVGCKLIYILREGSYKVAYFQVPDNAIRKQAIEMYYKLTGKNVPEEVVITEKPYARIIDKLKTRRGKPSVRSSGRR